MRQLKAFKKTEWKAMKIISEPSGSRGMVRLDEDGYQWEWESSGLKVCARLVTSFPWRNDLHRIMAQPAKFFKA